MQRIPLEVGRPLVRRSAAALEQVRPRAGLFGLVGHGVSQRSFDRDAAALTAYGCILFTYQ